MTTSNETIGKIVSQAKELSAGADDTLRRKLIGTFRDLSISLEIPEESAERITGTPLQLCIAKVATDLRLFTLLSENNTPFPLGKLAQETLADPVLLGRLMRYLASMKMVDEIDTDIFAANNVTHALASQKGQSYININFEIVSPAFHQMPDVLAKTNYVNPSTDTSLAFQKWFGFEGDFFAFLQRCPKYGNMFDTHMKFQRESSTNWPVVVKILKHQRPALNDDIIFVDLGGGIGHQCARLKATDPNLPGRVILQDLPWVLDHALHTTGVEVVPCSLFDEPPVKGAKFYYMRGVLHDFPDSKCKEMLQNVSKAMTSDSRLLVDEMVLPGKDVHWQAALMDLQLLSCLGSQERTRMDWDRLFASAGLKILAIEVNKAPAYESLIVCST